MTEFYTLIETLMDQWPEHMEALVYDRGEYSGREPLYVQNSMFGFDLILKRYCGFKPDYQLKAMTDSAPIFEPPWSGQFSSPFKVAMNYPAEMAQFYLGTGVEWIGMASPFLYLMEMMVEPYNKEDEQLASTIFFLSHSDRWLYVDSPHDEIIDHLNQLPDQFKPVTVSMYWRDIKDGHHIPYQNAGFKIVCPGHRFDDHFSERLFHLINIHKYAMGNNFGSYTFFSVAMGKPFSYISGLDPKVHLRPGSPEAALENKAPLENKTAYTDLMKDIYTGLYEFVTPEQGEFAMEALGQEFLKNPRELRDNFVYAEGVYNEKA